MRRPSVLEVEVVVATQRHVVAEMGGQLAYMAKLNADHSEDDFCALVVKVVCHAQIRGEGSRRSLVECLAGGRIRRQVGFDTCVHQVAGSVTHACTRDGAHGHGDGVECLIVEVPPRANVGVV